MPKTLLTGTLEEQCAFLFNLAEEKAAAGNFSGASHALKEILAHVPDYPGAAELMEKVCKGKREQRMMLFFVFAFGILGVFLGGLWQVPNDWWYLGLVAAGAVVGFLVGNLIIILKNRNSRTQGQESAADAAQQ